MGLPRRLVLPLAAATVAIAAYAADRAEPSSAPAAAHEIVAEATGDADRAEAHTVVVYKSPTCGCCTAWEDHLRESGFRVRSETTTDLAARKAALGVPAELASCHTAVVDGYVVEGHVPADALRRLLAEAPDARGLFVPGMPAGSPGMELPSGARDAYDVLLVAHDGGRTVFQRVL